MDTDADHIELVKKAQLGEKDCLNSLAEVARLRLREYVYRLTLQEDLTEDIVQESILEMLKVFDKLRDAERFWSWLHGIAFNKVRSRYGKQWRHRTVSLSDMRSEIAGTNSPDGLAEVIASEWRQIVTKSIQELEPRHRAVLAMRCYDKMAYSEIARIMDCTEIGVRALFYRAKKSLAKKLSGYGLGKGALLTALVLFGKMTATSEAAAAKISVTAGTVKVGTTATFVGAVASKSAMVSLAAAGVVAVGSVVIAPSGEGIDAAPQKCQAESCVSVMQQPKTSDCAGEYWYFFPEGAGKAVMIRLMRFDGTVSRSYCQGLQNQHANYHLDDRKNAVCINNYRMWEPDLSVWRLPTDSQGLSEFISQVEGRQKKVEYVSRKRRDGLVVIAKRSADCEQDISFVNRHRNILEEEYFQWDWPGSLQIIDNRDAMHKRGWTYFSIEGQINGRQVSGTGRIPFVHTNSKRHYPWLILKVGEKRLRTQVMESCLRDWAGPGWDCILSIRYGEMRQSDGFGLKQGCWPVVQKLRLHLRIKSANSFIPLI